MVFYLHLSGVIYFIRFKIVDIKKELFFKVDKLYLHGKSIYFNKSWYKRLLKQFEAINDTFKIKKHC